MLCCKNERLQPNTPPTDPSTSGSAKSSYSNRHDLNCGFLSFFISFLRKILDAGIKTTGQLRKPGTMELSP